MALTITAESARRALWRPMLCLAAAIFFCPNMTRADARAPLTLYTEEYPPITFAEQGKPSGLAVEIVKDMIRRSGYQTTMEVVPWARGYESAKTQRNVGLFVASRTDERELLFKWVGPISAVQGSLYAKRGRQKPQNNLEDARGFSSIAVPREWYLHQILRTKGFTNLYPVTSPAQAMRMLGADRAQAIALDNLTLIATAKNENIVAGELEAIAPIIETRQYLVFSTDTADSVINDLQQALDAMRADGTLIKIYRHWLPGVAPPK